MLFLLSPTLNHLIVTYLNRKDNLSPDILRKIKESLRQLIDIYLEGKDWRIGEILADLIYRIASSFLRERGRDIDEDIIQDVCLKAFGNLTSFHSRDYLGFQNWIRGIVEDIIRSGISKDNYLNTLIRKSKTALNLDKRIRDYSGGRGKIYGLAEWRFRSSKYDTKALASIIQRFSQISSLLTITKIIHKLLRSSALSFAELKRKLQKHFVVGGVESNIINLVLRNENRFFYVKDDNKWRLDAEVKHSGSSVSIAELKKRLLSRLDLIYVISYILRKENMDISFQRLKYILDKLIGGSGSIDLIQIRNNDQFICKGDKISLRGRLKTTSQRAKMEKDDIDKLRREYLSSLLFAEIIYYILSIANSALYYSTIIEVLKGILEISKIKIESLEFEEHQPYDSIAIQEIGKEIEEEIDFSDWLYKAILSLPEGEREAVLCYFNDLPPLEAAKRLGISRSAYDTRKSRALAKLKSLYEKDFLM